MRRASLALLGLALASCGSKTPLLLERADASVRVDAGSFDAGTDAGFDAGTDAGPTCVPGGVPLEASTVEVVFVIDRSGSMQLTFDGEMPVREPSRWEVLEAALSDALMVFDDRIGVGAKFFPTQTMRATEGPCDVFDGLDVRINPGSAPGIISHFTRYDPFGGTPLGPALREALDALQASPSEDSAQFIVAATDGAPTCGEDAVSDALDVIRESHERNGIDVYVIGIASTPREVDLLDIMATAGGRPRPSTEPRRFYDARDPALPRVPPRRDHARSRPVRLQRPAPARRGRSGRGLRRRRARRAGRGARGRLGLDERSARAAQPLRERVRAGHREPRPRAGEHRLPVRLLTSHLEGHRRPPLRGSDRSPPWGVASPTDAYGARGGARLEEIDEEELCSRSRALGARAGARL